MIKIARAVVTDTFLTNIAKAINGEVDRVPAYLLVGTTEVSSISTSASTLSGEAGTRVALSGSRSGNIVTLSGTRSSTQVLSSTGDPIYSFGMSSWASANTSDDLFTGVLLSGTTQTTNYDLEFINTISIERRT